MKLEPKERATFALNRARRMLEDGEMDAAIYHIEQSIIDAENEEREACATLADDMSGIKSIGGDIGDAIRARGQK